MSTGGDNHLTEMRAKLAAAGLAEWEIRLLFFARRARSKSQSTILARFDGPVMTLYDATPSGRVDAAS